ncbi:S8 family serine peptidase [Sandarakinorhabdus rubra]|uniref:S8 family serine peptidase n=1 Tax=Sandarakinorhabdus rubra TaxID=2672568 RepID=UPI0013DA329B|nr:S8 family serine peptidase [Sandarakinorhabdus rubra]
MSIERDEYRPFAQRGGWELLGGDTWLPLGVPEGGATAPKPAPSQQPQKVEILVQFQPGVAAEAQKAALLAAGGGNASLVAGGERGDLLLVEVPQGKAASAVMEALARNPNVSFAEPNGAINSQGSNDPNYTGNKMWGLYGDATTPANQFGSQAGEAWAAGHTGSMKTVIGVIDSGIDYTHPDLYLNIWLNPGEIPTNLGVVDTDGDSLITFRDLNHSSNASKVSDLNANGYIDGGDLLADKRWENGVDNDGNGRIDDLVGWDFFNNDNDPMDGSGHGTHVAGTIGAMGNNGVGVAGVNWNVQLMALKFLPDSGSGTTAGAVSAINYYTAAAAKYDGGPANYVATNNSWGGTSNSSSVLNAIVDGAKRDVLFIAAAGNGGSDKVGDDNDVSPYFPTNYSTTSAVGWDAVISVTAIGSTGARAGFANYGDKNVDLGAPGVSILSTLPGGKYGNYNGTSMATPHVTGAIGLLSSANEALTGAQIRNLLLSTTTATSSLQGITVTGGRLNVADLLAAGAGTAAPAPSPTPSPTPTPTPTPTTTAEPGVIYGTSGSDKIIGTTGNDVIMGVSATATGSDLSVGQIDELTGNGGNDVFVLGDSRGPFYDRDLVGSRGLGEYAIVRDFSEGDRIQLAAGQTYFLRPGSTSLASGTTIFMDQNGNGAYDTGDELLAIVEGKTLTFADIVFYGGADTPPPPEPAPPPPSGGTIYGTKASDIITGTTGNDVIMGVAATATGSDLWNSQIDQLIGNGGNDLFVLGDARGPFYDRDLVGSRGLGEYAIVRDFSEGDRIQLAAGQTYFLRPGSTSLASGTTIWMDQNGNGAFDTADELLAIVEGKTLTFADIVFG